MTCKCGRQTNDPSGICVICNLKTNDPDTIQGTGNSLRPMGGQKAQRHRERSMQYAVRSTKSSIEKHKNNVPGSLICLQCQKPYKPTSSAQKRCPACKKIHISEYSKNYRDKTLNLKPHTASHRENNKSKDCAVDGCKNPIKTQGLCNKHYLQKLKKEGRIGIRKNPSTRAFGKKSQVSWKRKWAGNGNIGADRSSAAEPEIKLKPSPLPPKRLIGEGVLIVESSKENVIPAKAGIQCEASFGKDNGFLAQMLYASTLLDGLINSILKDNTIDIKVILDIRFRLGEVVRGSIPA